MTTAQLESLKALVLAALAFAAVVGLVAANVAGALVAVVGAAFVALGAFLVKPPHEAEQIKQNAAVTATVEDVAQSGQSALVDIKTSVSPQGDVVTPVIVAPAVLPAENA